MGTQYLLNCTENRIDEAVSKQDADSVRATVQILNEEQRLHHCESPRLRFGCRAFTTERPVNWEIRTSETQTTRQA
jgi:hypothetical protein